jgi:hypothetical protein
LGHRIREIEEAIQMIAKGVRNLTKQKVSRQPPFSEQLQSWKGQLDDSKTQMIQASQEEFAQWKENLKIQTHPIAAHHGQAVIEAYFGGQSPFKTISSKDQFPDAFIWQATLDILQQYKSVHFVSNNTKDFEKICQETKGVIFHSSLEKFLISPNIKGLLVEQFAEQNFERILATIRQKEPQILPQLIHKAYELFRNEASFLLEDLLGPTVNISGWGYGAERDCKGYIDYEQAEHYGYGIISLPFVLTIEEFDVDYDKAIHISQLSSHHINGPSSKADDYVSLFITERFPLKLYTSTSISLWVDDANVFKMENISQMIEQAAISIDEIYEIEPDETKRQRTEEIL